MPLEVTAANTGGEEAVHEPAQDLAVLLTDALGEVSVEALVGCEGCNRASLVCYTSM